MYYANLVWLEVGGENICYCIVIQLYAYARITRSFAENELDLQVHADQSANKNSY